MTVRTGDRRVRPVKDEIGTSGMIENTDIPVLAGMARFTFTAVVAIVIIILEMTADAFHLHHIVERILAVTVVAGEHCVLALQREVSIAGVVETCVCP